MRPAGPGRGFRLLCTTAAALAALMLAATEASAQTLTAGVKGGINLATITVEGDDGDSPFDSRIGLVAGGFVTWRALSWLELQPEVLFTSKGASVEDEFVDSDLILDYVEVPVLGRYTWSSSGRTRFYVAGGPTFAFRLRAKARTEFSGTTEELDVKDEVEPFDLGVAFGGGVEFGSLVFDGRYTLGLSDIDSDTSDELKNRTRAITFTAGFRF